MLIDINPHDIVGHIEAQVRTYSPAILPVSTDDDESTLIWIALGHGITVRLTHRQASRLISAIDVAVMDQQWSIKEKAEAAKTS